MSGKYELYVIRTTKNIESIELFLSEKTDCQKNIGPIRKDFSRDSVTGKYFEKPMRFIILNNSFYNKMIELGYGEGGIFSNDFEITPYRIKKEDFAHRRSSVMHYYYPLEKNRDNTSIIKMKLNYLTKMNILLPNSWYIHENVGICEFLGNVPLDIRILVKIMIDSPDDFRVSWCRHNLYNRIQKHFESIK